MFNFTLPDMTSPAQVIKDIPLIRLGLCDRMIINLGYIQYEYRNSGPETKLVELFFERLVLANATLSGNIGDGSRWYDLSFAKPKPNLEDVLNLHSTVLDCLATQGWHCIKIENWENDQRFIELAQVPQHIIEPKAQLKDFIDHCYEF
jgi:hypothetical protein